MCLSCLTPYGPVSDFHVSLIRNGIPRDWIDDGFWDRCKVEDEGWNQYSLELGMCALSVLAYVMFRGGVYPWGACEWSGVMELHLAIRHMKWFRCQPNIN